MNKVLVTGCAGFIGSNLTEELINQGYDVIGIDNLSSGKKSNMDNFINNKNFHFRESDIREKTLYIDMDGVDTVFHLAASARIQPSIDNPVKYHDNNVNGTLNVLEAAVKAKVKRVVYSSSSSVYGVQDIMPENETAETKPLNPYAGTKLIGEIYCKIYSECYGLDTVCFRYFNVYGKRQVLEGAYATVIGIFLDEMKKGHSVPIVGKGDRKRDFTNVEDVVNANILASKSKFFFRGEVINIGTGKNYTIMEVAKLLGAKIRYIPERRFEVFETLADISKAEYWLDWKSKISLEEGIRRLKDEQIHQ
jgi:nucleoside-diphosphate-sugar epimerase